MAAPTGGSLMILSWIALSLVFAVGVMRDETQGEAIPDPPPSEAMPDLRPRQGIGVRIRLSLASKMRAFRHGRADSGPLRGLAFGKSRELRRPPGADGRDKPGHDGIAALYAPENLILAPMPRQGELMSDPRPGQDEAMPDNRHRQGEATPDPRPTLYLFCGKIAAGKSALASRLSVRPATVLISEDHWNANLFQAELKTLEDYARYSKRLRAAMGPHVVSLLRVGLSVVLDFPANGVGIRRWMRGIFEEANAAHELHFLDVSDEVCKRRLRERNAAGQHPFQTGEADYELFTSYFTPPSPDEGFKVIVHKE
jgi:predicted kinase